MSGSRPSDTVERRMVGPDTNNSTRDAPDQGGAYRGVSALVMGLGTRQGGVGVARYLVNQGAEVTVTDLRPAEELRSALDELAGLPIRYVLGEHRPEDFERAEIVVRNPGVPAESPWLARARAAGARIEMEMTLFFRACPAPIIGITGTKGKTTTSTLCASILRVARPETVLAGNLVVSALDALPRIRPETPVVIELSSFQLEALGEQGMSPHIAGLTNISQDHLNRYPSFNDYIEAKRNIARHQRPGDWFVVNRDDPIAWAARGVGAGTVVPFGRIAGRGSAGFISSRTVPRFPGPRAPGIDELPPLPRIGAADTSPSRVDLGFYWRADRLIWRWDDTDVEICRRDELPLPGEHAVYNALAASAAAILGGATPDEARQALTQARPVADRQEHVATIDGVEFVNDTTATAPAAVLAALDTFRGRGIVLLAGGAGKGADLRRMATRVAAETRAIVLLEGSATPKLRRMLAEAGAKRIVGPLSSMAEAVDAAAELAWPGDVVLLSPGCASFGMFKDEFERGAAFRAAAQAVAKSRGGSEESGR